MMTQLDDLKTQLDAARRELLRLTANGKGDCIRANLARQEIERLNFLIERELKR